MSAPSTHVPADEGLLAAARNLLEAADAFNAAQPGFPAPSGSDWSRYAAAFGQLRRIIDALDIAPETLP